LLQEGTITGCRVLYSGSNEVFLVSMVKNNVKARAIYKPRSGESPLWDFPDGTLCLREWAAYLVSEALKWSIVPPTVLRGGPYGLGAVQWFVNTRPGTFHELRDEHREELKKIAAFDYLINNADRKAGHCLLGEDGRVWGIDHGLTFHTGPKLRTVIWEFGGEPIPGYLIKDLARFSRELKADDDLRKRLSPLLTREEIQAMNVRLSNIIRHPFFPVWSGSYRSVPWPPY
jgi:hypothetical protein